MKQFIYDNWKRDYVSAKHSNQVVKTIGLTFSKQGYAFSLQKINVMRKILTLAAVVSVFASCSKDVVHGDGNVITSERTLSNFSGVEVSGANNVYISYAPTVSVSVNGYENLVSHYITEVREGELHLHFDNDVSVKNDNVQVFITMPSFNDLELSGSSSITATGTFNPVNELEISTSGDGDINIEDITVNEYEVNSSGNSTLSTLGVKAKTADVEISGSSTVTLSVENKLDVQISGSGTVSYKGEPGTVNSNISGSGKVIKL